MNTAQTNFAFLQGGGEMGELTRNYDWLQTPLGPPQQWPQSLRTTLSILLHSKFPMFLFWGPELICFYNDAYRPSLGNNGKHPAALGQPAQTVWMEIWAVIKPLIDQVLAGGEATWSENQLIPIYRNGHMEEVYWTYSYSPVNDESGTTAGVFVTCTETTETVTTLQKLQHSEQQFQNLIRDATVGIVVLTGKEMRVEVVNEKYGNLIGRTPAELLHKPLFRIIPEMESLYRPILESVLVSGEPLYLYEQPYFVYLNGTKKEGFLNLVYQSYKEDSGKITGVTAICQDITEQVTARKKVEESEKRFRNLIEQAPVATCLFVGRQLIIEVANEQMIRYWGKGKSVMGKPLAEALPELRNHRILQVLDDVFTTGKEYSATATPSALANAGTNITCYYDYTFRPLLNEAGEVYGILEMAVDVTEQVLVRQKLEESEQYFRQLTDTVPTIIWLTDPTGYCTYLNKNWYALTGQSEKEAEGYGWLTATHPDDFAATGKLFTDANERQVPFSAAYRLRIKSGEYRWVIDIGSPKYSQDGVYEGMIGTVVDVHEQRLAEEKTRHSEARFRDLVAAAPTAITLFVGRNLIIETPNQTFIDIVGKGSNITGKPLREVMPELEAEDQPFLQILDEVYTSGKMFQTQGTQVKIVRNGVLTYNYYDFSYTPLLDAEGNTYAILDIAVDVTDQVIGRRKLEEAEERLRLSVEAAELGTYEVSLPSDDIITSARFDEIFGVPRTKDRSQYVRMFSPEDQAIREAAHRQALQTGMLDYTARIIKQPGSTHWVRAMGRLYFDEAGKPQRLLGVVQDITEQKEMERQKDDFLSIASHELKTPVTSIKGYAQIMEKMFRQKGDDRSADMVAKMNNQANRLNNLIADLLDVTKINNGRLQFNLTTFDFNEMVAEVVEDMQRISAKHIIEMKLGFSGQVTADRDRISQVMINLLSNAIKYSPDAGRILVITTNHGTELELCVEDFGIGISSEKKDQVFEQFYRVSGNKEHTFPGLGLGLYISSEIIKRMNGRIWVNSVEGKGSTFCFAIPVLQ